MGELFPVLARTWLLVLWSVARCLRAHTHTHTLTGVADVAGVRHHSAPDCRTWSRVFSESPVCPRSPITAKEKGRTTESAPAADGGGGLVKERTVSGASLVL